MKCAGIKISDGDTRCLTAGHIARYAINHLRSSWNNTHTLSDKIVIAKQTLREINLQISSFENRPKQKRVVPDEKKIRGIARAETI